MVHVYHIEIFGEKQMRILLSDIEGTLGGVFALWILFTSIIAFRCFWLAYKNLRPGFRMWHFVFQSRSEIQNHPDHFFTQTGLFWIKSAQYTIILMFAGIIVIGIVSAFD